MLNILQIFVFFVFFKQKTAYEMRISDWSSDVCSSDLLRVCIDVVGDTVFLDLPGQQCLTLDQLGRRTALQMVEQASPVPAHRAAVVQQFVIGARRQDRKSVV